jgi:hypothetical protein
MRKSLLRSHRHVVMAPAGGRDSGHCFSAYPNRVFPESGTRRKLRFLMFNTAMETARASGPLPVTA